MVIMTPVEMISPLKDLLRDTKLVLVSDTKHRIEQLQRVGLDVVADHSVCYRRFNLMRFEPVARCSGILFQTTSKVAFDKARDYESENHPVVIVAIATVAKYKTQMFGKPYEAINVRRMLQELNGEAHKVVTGVYMMKIGDVSPGTAVDRRYWRERYFEMNTTVKLKALDKRIIEEYAALEESVDFPGGYNINKRGLSLVDNIEGEVDNVRGFPLFTFCNELRKMLEGKPWHDNVLPVVHRSNIQQIPLPLRTFTNKTADVHQLFKDNVVKEQDSRVNTRAGDPDAIAQVSHNGKQIKYFTR